jgi:hypothetical protein
MAQESGNLDGSRSAREDQQPVAGGMTGQVHQHIDRVAADQRRHVLVTEANNRAPVIGQGAEARGDGVLHRHFGIAEEFHGTAIEGREQRVGEQGDGVLAEIGETKPTRKRRPSVRLTSNTGFCAKSRACVASQARYSAKIASGGMSSR